MDNKQLASDIINLVGGPENVEAHTHCMTRLRLVLKDPAKADVEAIKALDGVQGVVEKAGQFQIIIGPSVDQLYDEMLPILGTSNAQAPVDENLDKKKENPFNTALAFITGCITPTLPILIGSGLISAILALLTNFNLLSSESSTYIIFNTLANAGFTYLPVMIAFVGARRLKTNEFIAAFIMLALCSDAISNVEGLSLFGIPLIAVKYTSNILPALIMVPVMAAFDRFVVKHTPEAVTTIVRPFIVSIVMFILTLFVFGPIGTVIGGLLANFCIWISTFGPLSMAILSALHPLLVMVGMHTLLVPVMTVEITTFGSSLILSKALAANLSIAGAALAVGVKAKKQENKETGISTGITALFSVTEPALYGCLIRLRRPLISAIISSAIVGAFIGLFNIRGYAIASCSLLTLPIFMGGNISNFILACVAAALAVVLGFVITWVIGFKEDE